MRMSQFLSTLLICGFSFMSHGTSAASLGIDWPPTKMVNDKYVLGPSFEPCDAFGRKYAKISSDATGLNWDDDDKAAGNYFYAPRLVRSMETKTDWVCLIRYNVAIVEGGRYHGYDFRLQELHHVNKQTGKFRTTPTELNDR